MPPSSLDARRRLLLAAPLLLAGCSDVARPFWGNPGQRARALAVPFAIRLAVLPADGVATTEAGAAFLTNAVTLGLQEQDVPAFAGIEPLPLDWRLATLADPQGPQVRLRFRLVDADGAEQGVVELPPIPAATWAAGNEATMRQVSAAALPGLTRMMFSIQAARAAGGGGAQAVAQRIRFLPITGAPGDGANALATRMREFMANAGWVVQEAAAGAEYGLTAQVRVEPPRNGRQVVDLQWVVTRRDGQELGRVVQVEEVPAGRLDRFWGDIAYVAAEQAAGGVQQIIRNAAAGPAGSAAPARR